MNDWISSIVELEACIGAPPLPVKMKVIDHLDDAAREWIAASPIAFVGMGTKQGPRAFIAGGDTGFASVRDAQTLVLPREAVDGLKDAEAGAGIGVLFLAAGIGETLRANGRVAAVTDDELVVTIEECFIHCAKALIRSDFWSAAAEDAPEDVADFVNSARFLVLATMDRSGQVDISPKGDPPGLLARMDGARITLAERPGNRLAFGYRNIIEQPAIAALAIIPGSTRVVSITGRAALSTDETIRSSFAVEGRAPLLVTMLSDVKTSQFTNRTLERAQLWTSDRKSADIDPAAAFVAHVKLNKERGVQATMLRLAVNRGLVSQGLKENYKKELY